MKIVFKLFIFAVVVCSSLDCFAQKNKSGTDTIYYLVDTAKIPVNDRMVKTEWENGGYAKDFIIDVPCLMDHVNPSFICSGSAKAGKVISRSSLHKLKLVNLSTLISLLCIHGAVYTEKYVTYFVEPYGHKYIIHKVGFSLPRMVI
jgi:hypothetical protein